MPNIFGVPLVGDGFHYPIIVVAVVGFSILVAAMTIVGFMRRRSDGK